MSWCWLSVAVALFTLGSIDVSLNLYRNMTAFALNTSQAGAMATFDDMSSWAEDLRSICFISGGIISDAALMYRCWVISGRQRILLVLPSFLFFAACACASVSFYCTSTLDVLSTIPAERMLRSFLTAYLATTLANNLICTGLIVYHIWRVNRHSSEFFTRGLKGSGRLDFIALNRIFIESALVYTGSVSMTCVAAVLESNVFYAFSGVSLALAGVSFDLIIIRISRGVATEQTQDFTATFRSPVMAQAATADTIFASADARDPEATDITCGTMSYLGTESVLVDSAKISNEKYDIGRRA